MHGAIQAAHRREDFAHSMVQLVRADLTLQSQCFLLRMPVGAQLARQRMQPRVYEGTRPHGLEAGVMVLLVEDAGGRPAGAAAHATQGLRRD